MTSTTPDTAHEDAVLGGPAPRYPAPADPDAVQAAARAAADGTAAWPFRHVAFSCDHPAGCEDEVDADIRADTFEQALPFLLDYARRQGWYASEDGRTGFCPTHRTDTDGQADALLGVPAGGDEAEGR